MKAHWLFRIVVTILSLPGAVGCSAEKDPRPKPVPASGVVRFNGQPLEGAYVTFINSTAPAAAYGRTDADGKFTLTTFAPGDGVVPGKQQVTVSKVQDIGHPVDKSKAPVWRPSAPPAHRWLIPKHYSSVETSGLTVEVPESGNNEIVLELRGPAGAR